MKRLGFVWMERWTELSSTRHNSKIKSLMYAEEVLLSDKNLSQRNISPSCIQTKIKISIGKSFSKVSNTSKTSYILSTYFY